MSPVRFYFEVLKKAVTAPFERADKIAGLIGIIGGLAGYFVPKLTPYAELASWAIPVIVLVPLTIYRMVLSPYWLFSHEQSARLLLVRKIEAIEGSLPRIVFQEVQQDQLFRGSQFARGRRQIYRILQAWFVNVPELPSESSLARNVTARIEVHDEGSSELLFQVTGQWALTTAPGHTGFERTVPEIDIPPGHLPVKLNVAYKYPGESVSYPFSQESFFDDPDGRMKSMELGQGAYKLRVHLVGIGISAEFWFLLEDTDPDAPLSLRLLDGAAKR